MSNSEPNGIADQRSIELRAAAHAALELTFDASRRCAEAALLPMPVYRAAIERADAAEADLSRARRNIRDFEIARVQGGTTPPSDPPAPEPLYSDAVKEAIALVDAHPTPNPPADWGRVLTPEPANAQGREGTPIQCNAHCKSHGPRCAVAGCGACQWDSRHDPFRDGGHKFEWPATTTPPSPPRFTAEEALEEARLLQREGNACPRTQATLRHYADLLDRDDALERAAEEVLRSWNEEKDLDPHARAMSNLRSVLAQRAKEKA